LWDGRPARHFWTGGTPIPQICVNYLIRDPNFHYGEDKKPYLAFDLMEEFRSPIVDSFVLKLINNSIFKLSDFERVVSTGGIYLSSQARREFIEQFERRMNEQLSHPDLLSPVSYREAIQLQVRRYKRSLVHGVPYEPFLRTV
jgi:CRISPR-associated protein Cas1